MKKIPASYGSINLVEGRIHFLKWNGFANLLLSNILVEVHLSRYKICYEQVHLVSQILEALVREVWLQ